MMKKWLRSSVLCVAGFGALLTAHQAVAQTQLWCRGSIYRVLTEANGTLDVFTSWRNDYIKVCNINYSFAGISSDICKNWYSMFVTAQATKQEVIMYYNSNYTSCAEMPIFDSGAYPGYVMLFSQ